MAEYYKSENGKRTLMALSKIKQDKQIKVDITDYQDVADCIRSDFKYLLIILQNILMIRSFINGTKRNTYEKREYRRVFKKRW